MTRFLVQQRPSQDADGKSWSDEETIALLDIWGSDEIRFKLSVIKRNRLVWEEIERLMIRRGHRRSAKQCCGKIHNLKVEFRKVKTCKKENNFKFFRVMEPLMVDDVALANAERSEPIVRSEPIHAPEINRPNFDQEGCVEFQPDAIHSAIIPSRSRFDLDVEEAAELASIKVEPQENSSDVDPIRALVEHSSSSSSSPFVDAEISVGRKRKRDCAGLIDAGVVLDKLKEMREESERRFYEWEEKRSRLEMEREERRQRLESEREIRRERFLIQLIGVLRGDPGGECPADGSNFPKS